MSFAYYTLLTLLMFVSVLLILLILIQKGRGGGLSSAFGGGGGSTAFGAKTGDVLTWATSIIFGIFILLAVSLDLVVDAQYKSNTVKPSVPTLPTPVVPDNPVQPTTLPTATMPTTTISTSADSIGQLVKQATTQVSGAMKAATTKP